MGERPRGRRRLSFILVVAACWVLGLFGLERGRLSSVQLPLFAVAGLAAYLIFVGFRRHTEHSRDRLVHPVVEPPPTCVVVRWLGEGNRDPLSTTGEALVPQAQQPVEPPPQVQSRRRAPKHRLDYIPLTGA